MRFRYAYTSKTISRFATTLFLVTVAAVNCFILRMISWVAYDPAISSKDQDYVFDLMAISELSFVLAAFALTYLINPYTKLAAIVRSIFRVIMFATLFTTGKELAGINTTNAPFEALLFSLVILTVGFFSAKRIKRWQK